jgi:hypothetical protein
LMEAVSSCTQYILHHLVAEEDAKDSGTTSLVERWTFGGKSCLLDRQ